jgi:hypothetical protein
MARFLRNTLALLPVCAAFTVLLAEPCLSQVQKDPQAVNVIAKSLAAMGGASISTYQDFAATGSVTLSSPDLPTRYPIRLSAKGTQQVRLEVDLPKGTNVRILNRGRAILKRPDGSVRYLIEKNTFNERVSHIPVLSLLGEFKNDNITVRYLGATQLTDHNADVVALENIQTSNARPDRKPNALLVYINQLTNMVDKIQYVSYAENGPDDEQKVEIYFAGYKQINSISVPLQQSVYTDGTLESSIVFDSITFNDGLSDALFLFPAVTDAK